MWYIAQESPSLGGEMERGEGGREGGREHQKPCYDTLHNYHHVIFWILLQLASPCACETNKKLEFIYEEVLHVHRVCFPNTNIPLFGHVAK